MTATQEKKLVAAIDKVLEAAHRLDEYPAAKLEALKTVYRTMASGRDYITAAEETHLTQAALELGWEAGLIADFLAFKHACRRRDELAAAYGVED